LPPRLARGRVRDPQAAHGIDAPGAAHAGEHPFRAAFPALLLAAVDRRRLGPTNPLRDLLNVSRHASEAKT
jgi:hypothetical protein